MFYGTQKLNYKKDFYEITIYEQILDIPYKIKALNKYNLDNKQKKIFRNYNILDIIYI